MTTQATSIHAVAKDAPEQALLAAVIQRAVSDAQSGDMGARNWLRGDACLHILIQISPTGIDPRCLQQRMLNRLEAEDD